MLSNNQNRFNIHEKISLKIRHLYASNKWNRNVHLIFSVLCAAIAKTHSTLKILRLTKFCQLQAHSNQKMHVSMIYSRVQNIDSVHNYVQLSMKQIQCTKVRLSTPFYIHQNRLRLSRIHWHDMLCHLDCNHQVYTIQNRQNGNPNANLR